MKEKISVRKAPFAKIGLQNFCDYIKEHYNKSVVLAEIGSYVGDSTEIFAKNFKAVYSIDPWQNGYEDKLIKMDEVTKSFMYSVLEVNND